MDVNQTDPLKYYLDKAIYDKNSWISEGMEGYIPNSIDHAISLAKHNFKDSKSENPDLKSNLSTIFESSAKKYGIFTERAKNNLNLFLNDGLVIEVSHQPKFMGGERFVYNKIACGAAFSKYDKDFLPVFYVADYDKVHAELIKTRFSQSNSSSGFCCSIDTEIEKQFDCMRIKNLPLPTYEYLEEIFMEIRNKYEYSFNLSIEEVWQRKLYEERLEEALRIIKSSYYRSMDYSDWFINILGVISNIIFDYGYLYISASDSDYKKLLTPAYEYLLKNQNLYIEHYINLREQYLKNSVNPPLREINKNFVPFFYECPVNHCNHRRIELEMEPLGSFFNVSGKCEECGTRIEFNPKQDNPDLSEQIFNFTPRVESRQYLVSKTLSPAIHVAGTGETKYYTMGIPLIRKFDKNLHLPIIFFYNKTTMNTFMTRRLEQDIINLQVPGFLDNIKLLMKNVGKFNKMTKKNKEPDRTKLVEILNNIKEKMVELDKICSNFNLSEQNSETKNIISSYLSNMFGKISIEKSGQEAIFHWIDLCIKNGLSGFFEDYDRIYQRWLPPGMEIFI